MKGKELKLLKLEEMTNLVWIIFIPLLVIILIYSFFQYGFFFWFEYFLIAGLALFLGVPVFCIILGLSIKILSTFNVVKTDGNWGTFDIMKSFFSELYSEDVDDED